MSEKVILHVLTPDKFTIPLISLLNKELVGYNHIFLCVAKFDDNPVYELPNVVVLQTPHRRNIIHNLWLTFQYIRKSSKIILHGNPALYLLFILYFFLPKIYWGIYGGADMGTIEQNKGWGFNLFIKKTVLNRVNAHITHIKGDSDLANTIFKSKAEFVYSPMYLSNTYKSHSESDRPQKKTDQNKKILIGNSTEPSNNHFEIFEILLPYKDQGIIIYCPLSYGVYYEYRDKVISKGKELFDEQFFPLTQFMNIDEYQNFLNNIDVAVFNHNIQAAMGVTISLLAQEKIIYMDSNTTSFKSFISRGFQVFDINLIRKGELLFERDISSNKVKANEYYSEAVLLNSWLKIYQSN